MPSTPNAPNDDLGIVCRKCECPDLRVTRTVKVFGGKIRRTRECQHCGAEMTTTEAPTDVKMTGNKGGR